MANLRYQILTCERCPLAALRTLAVPAEVGEAYAGLAVMAEAPGAQEDATGRPMVGRAGKLLDKLLVEAGMSRDEVLIINRIRCRPPQNRMASAEAVAALAACDPWLKAELEEYDPKVVVVMGKTAMTPIFGATAAVTSTRGSVRATGEEFGYGKRLWVATAHPAAAFRSKSWLPLIVEDLRMARGLL